MFFIVAEGNAVPFADAAGAGSAGFGIFMAAMPVGTALGEVLAGTLLGAAARDRIALPMAAFAIHPSLPLAVALMLLTGLCAAYTLGMDQWFVQALPPTMRGSACPCWALG
jgi:hypothetical protein